MGAASRSFDGTDDNISMGNVLDVTTGDFTVGTWVKMTENANSEFIIGKRSTASATAGSASGYIMRTGTGDLLACGVSDSVAHVGCGGVTAVLDGAWYYVQTTWNATTEVLAAIVNGTQENSGTGAMGSLTNAVAFTMGTDSASNNDLTGLEAYGSFHSAVLSAVELTEMRWHVCSIPTNLGGCWPLWGDSTEIDLSGNGNAGTVANATTSTDGPPTMVGAYLPL